MSAAIASAAIGAVGAGYKIYQGISQNSAANKLQRGLVRPMYSIQPQYYNNQSLAENQAQEGLSEDAKNYYGDQANAGLSAGISGILQGGGDVNNINSLYDKYNTGNRAIATQDSQLKNDNIRYLVDRNKDLAGQQTQQWAINQYEPYKDTATAISGLRGASGQNISGGISELGSVASIMGKANTPDTTTPTRAQSDLSTSSPITGGSPTQDSINGLNPSGSTPMMNTTIDSNYQIPGSDFNNPQVIQGAKADAINGYQNSPYYASLNSYMNQPLSA